jgi:hypothetical protein
MKLNPEDIEVVSFDTSIEEANAQQAALRPITDDPNHPTPATYCFVCD